MSGNHKVKYRTFQLPENQMLWNVKTIIRLDSLDFYSSLNIACNLASRSGIFFFFKESTMTDVIWLPE